MSSSITLKALGLNTQPNQLSTDPGSLSIASNVIIRRDNVIEPRRGFKLFGNSFGSSSDVLKQTLSYKNILLRHYGTTLQFQEAAGSETFLPFNGAYTETQTGLRIKGLETNGNFYFTTNEGIKKISAKTVDQLSTDADYITNAGGIKALDAQAFLNITLGDISGFLPADSAVAYRIVWGLKDANTNLILGTPSQRVEIYNPLSELTAGDLNNLLKEIDNAAGYPASPTLLSQTDYLSTLQVDYNAVGSILQTNIIALAAKLDADILYANDTGSGAPLNIVSNATDTNITGGVATITFSSGNPNDYWTVGSKIFLNNFTTDTGTINDVQTIASINSLITKTFAPADVNTGTDVITINAHGYVNNNVVQFSSSGTLPAGISANTDYFIITAAANTFQISTTAGGSAVDITTQGTGTHTVSNGYSITFATAATRAGAIAGTTSTITSGEYEYITSTGDADFPTSLQALVVDTPATHDELGTIQDTLDRIMAQLKLENALVIDAAAKALFIDPLETTTSANVDLVITIPDDVTSNDFFQIYRSSIVQATGATVLTDLTPSDELQLVYESFPTSDEISAQEIHVEDVTPDAFRGANLYTNASTGEGILQSNDIPPEAKDINKFKNYTFYANTRTRHRYSLNLLGVQQMIDENASGITPVLTIANADGEETFNFVTGTQEITNFFAPAGASQAASQYFTANSANDVHEYYFWFRKDGVGTDPAIANKTGIVIDFKATDTATQVSGKISAAFEALNIDFFVSPISTTFTSSGVDTGADTITVTYSGLIETDVVQFTTSSALPAGISALTNYYLKNVTDNGNGTITFQISTSSGGSAVNITGTGTGTQTMSSSPNVSRVTNVNEGPTTNATAGNSSVTVQVVQQGTGENASNNDVLLSQEASVAIAVAATAQSLVHVINKSSSSVYAYYLSGAEDVPGKILLESRTLGTTENPFYVIANNSSTGSSFNPNISPEQYVDAGTSILKDIPSSGKVKIKSTAHGLATGDSIVLSGSENATPAVTPSIDGVQAVTVIDADHFSIPASIGANGVVTAHTIGFTYLPTAEVSNNEVSPNRLYYSKLQQPEAVPVVNTIDLGAKDKAILRIVPLRDSLFVFKEDGLYRISGETAPFNAALFDISCLLLAPDSIGLLNNVIYGWTRKGIENITEAGITTISRPIDVDILPLATFNFTNFKAVTWGVGYESDNSYIVGTLQETTDTVAVIEYRYSNLTNSWTTFDKSNTCGIVSPYDDKLYMGAGDTNYLEQERKNFDRTDYADREVVKALSNGGVSNSGLGLKFPVVTDIEIGDVVVQEQFLSIYEFNTLLEKLDLDPGVNDSDFYSTLAAVSGSNLRSKLALLAAKLDADTGLNFTDYTDRITAGIGPYSTSISGVSVADPTELTTSAAHSLYSITNPSEGRWITISGTDSNATTNGTFEITRTGADTFTVGSDVISVADGTGSLTRLETDFRDIKACFNIIIDHLNHDTGASFSNYSRCDTTTIQEAIVTNINTVTKIVTLNLALQWVVGNVTVYKKIDSEFQYSQQTMGDPLGWKHIREATVMFENKAFTSAKLIFSTDLLPGGVEIPFNADSNGIFGNGVFFGAGFFGGNSNGAPFRTYLPAACQRCRYINMSFEHAIAREKYSIYGTTLTGNIGLSERAYK